MLQDGKTLRTAAAADLETLTHQIASLRDDMAALAQSVATTAERRGHRMASDVADGMGEALHYAERKGKSAEAELEMTIATHPLLALGLAAATGLLIGAMTRR